MFSSVPRVEKHHKIVQRSTSTLNTQPRASPVNPSREGCCQWHESQDTWLVRMFRASVELTSNWENIFCSEVVWWEGCGGRGGGGGEVEEGSWVRGGRTFETESFYLMICSRCGMRQWLQWWCEARKKERTGEKTNRMVVDFQGGQRSTHHHNDDDNGEQQKAGFPPHGAARLRRKDGGLDAIISSGGKIASESPAKSSLLSQYIYVFISTDKLTPVSHAHIRSRMHIMLAWWHECRKHILAKLWVDCINLHSFKQQKITRKGSAVRNKWAKRLIYLSILWPNVNSVLFLVFRKTFKYDIGNYTIRLTIWLFVRRLTPCPNTAPRVPRS